MGKTIMTGVLIGEQQKFGYMEHKRVTSGTFRTFYAMDVKTEIDREKLLEGSAVLVYPSRELSTIETFNLMCSAPEFSDVSTARKQVHDLEEYVRLAGAMQGNRFEVESVERIRKPKPAAVAPIDYDETVGLGKTEKETEYTGSGADFEL